MDLRATRAARAAASAVIALAVVAGPLLGTPAAYAAPSSPSYFNRKAVIGRAARWTSKGVPYSQTAWRDDYRTDCSGFLSYAWGLDQSYVTWVIPEIARPIAKEDLQPGDALLNLWKHVVIFGGWANKQHTAYLAYEQVGGRFRRAVRRVVAYPYDSNPGAYKPYRYTGGHNLYAPGALYPAPMIQTYAGGRPIVPSWAAAKNAQRQKVANERNRALLNRIHAQQRAEAAAKAKAQAQAAAARRAAEQKAAAERRLAEGDAKQTQVHGTPVTVTPAPAPAPGRSEGARSTPPWQDDQPAAKLLRKVLALLGV